MLSISGSFLIPSQLIVQLTEAASGDDQTFESAPEAARSRKSAIRVGIERLILSTRRKAVTSRVEPLGQLRVLRGAMSGENKQCQWR